MPHYLTFPLFFTTLIITIGITDTTTAEQARQNKASEAYLTISWEDNYLTIRGDFPGNELRIHYLEAYCRPESTDRDWSETVIPHHSVMLRNRSNRREIHLTDTLADGVIVQHAITAGKDSVNFRLIATNPTDRSSAAHWAQPCIRVNRFTGCDNRDARAVVPPYAHKCFLFIDGRLTRLPTTPWADQARYVPGQVYCPADVNRNDVNPRPLSRLVPSNGLTGCFSADEQQIMAVAWEPFQEIFQGVITCIHSDLRIGGLQPGETKKIHGKIYLVQADVEALLQRYRQDFPEQAAWEE